jgi:hypothetical protein
MIDTPTGYSFDPESESYQEQEMRIKWMVDVKGTGEGGEEALKEFVSTFDGSNLIDAQGGLASSVQQYAEESGYEVTDKGAGRGKWHIGVPFEELEEATKYLKLMTNKFKSAISKRLVRFELKTWSADNWK